MIKHIFLSVLIFGVFGLVNAKNLHTISIVVPFSAGSAQDLFARLISESLRQELRAPVLVVNKPGAAGTLGAAFVAQAKPDGHTYLLASSSLHLAGAIYPRLSYHPLNSLRGVAFLGSSDYVLITSNSLKTADLTSFVARIKSEPHAFNYASAGNGSVTHVGMASFLDTAGLSMVHIPLKGTGEIIREVRAGRVHAAMVSTLSIQAYKSDPEIQLLATTGLQRLDAFAQLPTLEQSGYPKFKWVSWTGLLAPSGTPADKMEHMNRAVTRVFHDPVMQARFHALGISPKSLSAHQFQSLLSDDWARSSWVIAQFKITLD
jgi:tripartite-type tricarboxylate transporter receptor subunit TctC